MEKYLQDAEQCQSLEVNYFDDNATGQNKEPNPEDAEQPIQFSKDNQIPPSQTFTADTNVARNPPESLKVRHWPYFKAAFTSMYRCR